MKTAQELQKEIDDLRAKVQQKDIQISSLEAQILDLQKYRFGSSSEKNPNQLPLFNEAESLTDTKPQAKKVKGKKKSGTRKPLPENLEREEHIHDLDDDSKTCTNDGTELKYIGDVTTEQLKFIPAQIKVIKHICKKYACPKCKKYIITATRAKDPIPKSMATPELLSYITASKYADGLPLYRLSNMFKRLDIKLSRTNLASWMIKCGSLVQPLINLMQDKLYTKPCINIDETTLQVLKEPGKKAQSKSYMWVMKADNTVLFNYDQSRSSKVADRLLADYQGAIMCDGYGGYESAVKKNQLTRLGCWAHARRYFIKVLDQADNPNAQQMIDYIAKLYSIEKQIRENALNPDEIKAYRQSKSVPVLNDIRQSLDDTLHSTTPSGLMGKALGYLHKQWLNLIQYVSNGHYPIDNNAAENAIRPFVIGRKNWLFANSVKGAKASANLYSLIETAKAQNINPEKYLTHIYRQIPNAQSVEDFERLLPENFHTV